MTAEETPGAGEGQTDPPPWDLDASQGTGDPANPPADEPRQEGTTDRDGRDKRPPPTEDDDEDPPLQDSDPDEAHLAEKEREDSEQVALDTRVAGFRRMFGESWAKGDGPAFTTLMAGDQARAYQAKYMLFLQGEGSRRSRAAPLPTRIMGKLRSTFAQSSSYRALLDGFADDPAQTLLGSPDTGRTTTALAAVAAWVAPDGGGLDGRVHVMEGPLASFDDAAVPKDGGLVFLLDGGEAAPGLAWLNATARTLAERRSVLVVVADTPAETTSMGADNLVRHIPPRPVEVLERHLSVRLRPDQVSALLAHPAVQLESHRCRSPYEAAALAGDLADGCDNGHDADAVLAHRDLPALEERIRQELAGKGSRTFLVTCAVLDGLTVGTVARERLRFAKLQAADDQSDGDDSTGRFDKPIGEWSGSVVVRSTGAGAGRTVHLVHPRLVAKVLETAWQDHVGMRDVLLDWLKKLAVHPDVQVRVKAAQAMAKLATYDFEVIKREVLKEWARDGRFRTRQAVAWALEALALADDGRFARRVQSMVRDWVRSQQASLQAAGVATYGTFLGAEYPESALQAMRRIAGGRLSAADGQRSGADRAERELANIVQKAILDMFLAGAHEQVIRELATWTRLSLWRWRRCAAECLVRLSRERGELPYRPLLMEIAEERHGFRGDVAQLWRNALLPEHQRVGAWEALRRLVLLAESAGRSSPEIEDRMTVVPAALDEAGSPADRSVTAAQASVRRLLSDIAAGDSPADAARVRSLRFHIDFWEFRQGRRLSVVPSSLR
ncbi:hypothetical protein ABGB17_16610 [Sphaerisporangium sp. B11E5]|uniref:hypothetical protein n=1 Tax=Sphaerisporangium sp. B11E5 TaxID=3153563 RepID=UPI00325D8A87